VTGGGRYDPEKVALLVVATGGSDLLDPIVLVAELVELAIRKTGTRTTTKTKTTEQTYFIRYLVVKINVSKYIWVNIKQMRFPACIFFYPTLHI